MRKKILFSLTKALHRIQVFSGEAKVTQDSCQYALGNVFASMTRDRSKGFILSGLPDFVGTWSLANKLTAQPAEFLGQYTIGHTGIRRSA